MEEAGRRGKEGRKRRRKDGRLQGVSHNCFLIFNLSSWLYLLYHQWSSERAKRLRKLDRANIAFTNFDGAGKRDFGEGWDQLFIAAPQRQNGEKKEGTERKINKREVLIQSFCENRAKWGLFGKA